MNSLKSLTANYTDSEGEELHHEEDGSPMATESPNVVTNISDTSNLTPTKPKSKTLVSYHDDTVVSDDEQSERAVSESPVEEKQPNFDDADLPPEPQGRCSHELQEKIKQLYYDKVLKNGLNMNFEIQYRKSFRNPSIYEKLIQYCSINEFGTNYAPEIYDPLRWNKSSYYDELAKIQKAEMDQREKERKEKTKVEVIVGTAKRLIQNNIQQAAEEEKKRKSKWDQVGSSSAIPLTTTVSGTKGTVISAFGSLNKKPRV